MRRILVSEIFGPVLQGEGALIGKPTIFVRTGGCDFRCAWCDTLYAVLPEHRPDWTPMTAGEILQRVSDFSSGRPMLITLSGGNPALQPLSELIQLGREAGYGFAMETQGTAAKPWFALLDYLVLTPKPPSSHMKHSPAKLAACLRAALGGESQPQVSLKVVVFDEADYQFARAVHLRHPEVPFFLQVGNDAPESEVNTEALLEKLRWLGGRVVEDGWNVVTVLPQLHVLMFGNRRGV